jgi:hypothetical protein
MTSANYVTSNTPQLTITCHDDLSITGVSEASVSIAIDADAPANRFERNGEAIAVTAMAACDIICPIGAAITIELVSGDLRVTQITGTLAVVTVNGDAALRDIGPLDVRTVQGDLSVRAAAGNVRIGTVCGDARLKHLGGPVTADRISGDLAAHDLARGATFKHIAGDASFELEFVPGQSYAAQADGDMVLRVNSGGAEFDLSANGEVRNRVPMNNWQSTGHHATGTLGDGAAQVALNANGDLLILPSQATGGFDSSVFSDQAESMIESAMSQMESQLSRVQHELEERWGKNTTGERAAERAKRSAERAQRRAERAAESWGTFFSTGRPAASAEPVSEAERLLVLKMVEANQISIEDAAQLLSSLEG